MEVMKKRKALAAFCENKLCHNCALGTGFSGDFREICLANFEKAPDEMIEIWHAKAFPEAEATAHPDYEAEYHKLKEEHNELVEQYQELMRNNNEIVAMCEALKHDNDMKWDEIRNLHSMVKMLEAQLDIVRLIFGGGRNV